MVKPFTLIIHICIVVFIVQNLSSCKDVERANTTAVSAYSSKPEAILKDFTTWYNYTNENVNLSRDFVGLDADAREVTKEAFLNLLQTGDYVPLKATGETAIPYYRLYRFNGNDKDIRLTIKQIAISELDNFQKVGKELPPYHWKDLQGNQYTNQSMKGKILVLKCWFIRCVACIKEFPELNEMVAQYSNRKDMAFVSLATDPREALSDFIKKRPFRYAVVPVSDSFMADSLSVHSFPTHIIVGKDGRITHVVNNYKDFEYALNKELENG